MTLRDFLSKIEKGFAIIAAATGLAAQYVPDPKAKASLMLASQAAGAAHDLTEHGQASIASNAGNVEMTTGLLGHASALAAGMVSNAEAKDALNKTAEALHSIPRE